MGDPNGPLKISPNFDANDWKALDQTNRAHWATAGAIVKNRLDGRFLKFASQALPCSFSGFVVLAIDSMLVEALQQFREGLLKAEKRTKANPQPRTSQALITTFLAGQRFQPDFDVGACDRYYWDIRCGLLHQAEAKELWLILKKQPRMLQPAKTGHGYIIDVERFHAAVIESLDDYVQELVEPKNRDLRRKLWVKMDHICNARVQRGVEYGANSGP